MHIAILLARFKTFSGAEHLVLQFSREAVELGHRVTIATRRFDEACRGLLDSRIDLRIAKEASFLTGIHLVDSLMDTLLSPALVRLVPADVDVVCALVSPTLPAMWLIRKRVRAPATAYYCLQPPRFAYDLQEETVRANGWLGKLVPLVAAPYRILDKRLAPHCDAMFTVSNRYADWCRELYGMKHVRVVYPGVDPDLGHEVDPLDFRSSLDLDPETLLVLTTNKLIARKNLDVFLEAMRLVVSEIPQARGIIIGDGPQRSELERRRDELGLQDEVRFVGFVESFRHVASWFASCDLYVFLERNVPFGLTVLEAGVCGRPVVAVGGGGTDETVLHGETGYHVAPRLDPLEVAGRILELLRDPEKRRRMGSSGREHARRFAWQNSGRAFVDALEEVYREVRT